MRSRFPFVNPQGGAAKGTRGGGEEGEMGSGGRKERFFRSRFLQLIPSVA